MSWYLWERFDVSNALRMKIFGVLPFGWTVFVVWLAGIVAGWTLLGGAWTALLAVPALLPLTLLLSPLRRTVWPRGVVTVGDLAEWVVRERAKDGGTSSSEPHVRAAKAG